MHMFPDARRFLGTLGRSVGVISLWMFANRAALCARYSRTVKRVDLIILATGFVAHEVMVAKLLGDEVAKKVVPVWGFGTDGEMTTLI